MIKKTLISIILCIFFVYLYSCNGLNVKPNYEKGFIKYFGSSTSKSFAGQVQLTSDGGYILIGTSNRDMYIAKTDAAGNMIWDKNYGGVGADSGRAIKQMSDGSFMALGTFYSTTNTVTGMYFLKLNQNGDTIWSKKYYTKRTLRNCFGADFIFDEQDNRFCLVGGVENKNQNQTYLGAFRVLVEADGSLANLQGSSTSSGNQQEEYITGINTFANCIIKDQNDYYFTGTSGNSADPFGLFLVQMNKNLSISNTMFQTTLQADKSVNATQMLKFDDGSYIFVGSGINEGNISPYILQCSSISFPSAPSNPKTTYLGNGKSGNGRSIVALKDGSGYVVVGSIDVTNANGNTNKNMYITKLRKDGSTIWEKNYGSNENDEASFIKQTADNGFIILANTKIQNSENVITLLKLDENGDIKN